MPFLSVLFTRPAEQAAAAAQGEPAYFRDLNLDQVVSALIESRASYGLEPFFHARMADPDTIAYRHEVFRDLEDEGLSAEVERFAGGMRDMRRLRARAAGLRHRYQKESWLVEAADAYCRAVRGLQDALTRSAVRSRGLRNLRAFLTRYVRSPLFEELAADIRQVAEALASVRYCMTIGAGRVTVTRYAGEVDYGARVLAAFEKFKQEEAESHLAAYQDFVDMNHVEEAVLDRVAQLYPEEFAALDDFCARHRDHPDRTVTVFDREVQFYLACLDATARLTAAGLPWCYPRVSTTSKDVSGTDVFDLALADGLIEDGARVVLNDFRLESPERVLVVSGPNQGGKTTFARAIGQLHHLAALGCPVPGTEARLFLCDEIFTHFERGENPEDLSGRLQDELVRVHDILRRATPASLVILNEVFTSTTPDDALLLGTRVLEDIVELGPLCVCVTFVDELSRLGPSTVSMTSTVVPDNPATRTFRVIRRPADGLSYALAVADAYGLTYERLTRRIGANAGERTVP